jgi:hypothetical protein
MYHVAKYPAEKKLIRCEATNMWTVFKYNPEYKWARDALIAVCSQCDIKDKATGTHAVDLKGKCAEVGH